MVRKWVLGFRLLQLNSESGEQVVSFFGSDKGCR